MKRNVTVRMLSARSQRNQNTESVLNETTTTPTATFRPRCTDGIGRVAPIRPTSRNRAAAISATSTDAAAVFAPVAAAIRPRSMCSTAAGIRS